MTTPDFETLTLDRMHDVNEHEIAGLRYASRLPFVMTAGVSDVPYAYCLIGRETPVKVKRGGWQKFDIALTLRLVGSPTQGAQDRTRGSGVGAVIDLVPFINVYRSYFFDHQGLETAANPSALAYLAPEGFTFAPGGIARGVEAGDVEHFMIDFALNFTFQWMC